jgi:phosphatidylglycerol:prolipoprotein diacylglycerol transferase
MNPPEWGIRPVLFTVAGVDIPAYGFFMALAVLAGILMVYREGQRRHTLNEKTFYIVLAALTGGILGSKAPGWVANFDTIVTNPLDCYFLLSGRTIVGGLIGGSIAVFLVKRHFQITERRGNILAPAIALGLGIGRIGCFLRGCCFGTATSLAWGVDFGDGIPRHPTQLYEAMYAFGVFVALQYLKNKITAPGKLFDLFIALYFAFRFLVEFIRVEDTFFLGLTLIQWVSLGMVVYKGKDILLDLLARNKAQPAT